MEIEIFIQAYLVYCGNLCQFIIVFPLIVSVDPTGTTIQYIYLLTSAVNRPWDPQQGVSTIYPVQHRCSPTHKPVCITVTQQLLLTGEYN